MPMQPVHPTSQIPVSGSSELPVIAVIADAHFHDIDSDYDFCATPFNGKSGTLRSWTDTRRASRVFNESAAALNKALDDIHQRGIRHVVLLGDYTDDGQIEATQRLASLLRQHRDEHGLHLYAIPGNHECYGSAGKHQSTRFVTSPGESMVVTSDPEVAASQADTAILTRKMYCEGTTAGLLPMREFGLFRQSEYLHWESPFGFDDAVALRRYDAHSSDGATTCSLMDASYLVEPAEGLWLLMIDANVFEPRNGQRDMARKKAFLDCSDAGWNALLRNRPYLLDWISDVCSRAQQLGKTLLTFSHYPIMDSLDDWSDSESRLFGQTEMQRRRPARHVAESLLRTGIQLHLGGHMHINGIATVTRNGRQLTDIAVPSLAAFPPAYKILQPATSQCRIETIALNDMPLDPWLMNYYRAENMALSRDNDTALEAHDYGTFLYRRMISRVSQRFLPREWPAEIAGEMAGRNAADLGCFLIAQRQSSESLLFGALPAATHAASRIRLASLASDYGLTMMRIEACSMMDLIVDWYCLRQAGHQAVGLFMLERQDLYRFLTQEFGDVQSTDTNAMAAFLSIFLGVMQLALQRLAPQDSMTDIIELHP